ncbi:MAG TPA: glycosyltransferase family 39 protein [Chloroflexota bacterium]|nr:glycosyltransferase family 39 protein [Chloroflexota bacterium]
MSRRGAAAGAALLIAYLLTRLTNLGVLPMVSDEGTYITWGVRALHGVDAQDWLASLEDGKQPLLAWLMPPFLAMVDDRLIGGRLVSVLTGLANLWLIVWLTRRLFGGRAGWIAGALYVAAPIALIHDRMALYDSLVATTSLVTLVAALRWGDRPDARATLGLGAAMAAAVLTKLSALFFVGLVPILLAVNSPRALRRWWLLAQAYAIAAAAYSVLYLSPIVDNLSEGNFQRYSLTLGEVLTLPLALWGSNALFVALTALRYLGPPLAAACVAGLVWLCWRRGAAGVTLAVWTVAPLLAFVLTAKIIYSRYIVFCFVCALPGAAALLADLSSHVPRARAGLVAGAATALAAAPGLTFAVSLLRDPATAPWLDDRRWITDRFQYVESNYAGYGLREIVEALKNRAGARPVVVLTRTATGMPRDGVGAYLLHQPGVEVGLVPEQRPVRTALEDEPIRAFQLANQGAPVYYVLTDAPNGEQERRFAALNPEARLELALPKPGNHSRFLLYQLPWTAVGEDRVLSPPAAFEEGIHLAGYNVSTRSVRPGEAIRLTLYWEAAARPARDLTVFTHIAGAGDLLVGQSDGQPASGRVPTGGWRPGQFVGDTHLIQIRAVAAPGDYELRTGLYELSTLQRIPVTVAGGQRAHVVPLGRITVLQPLSGG